MKTSLEGRRVLEYFEGRRNEAYLDGGGVPTIGIGHTGPEVHLGLLWSDEKVDATLEADLLRFERGVDGFLVGKRIPTQGEFDALVLFSFNVGLDQDEDTKAEGLGDSTLLRKYLAGDLAGAQAEWPKWNKDNGHVVLGLVRRRAAELDLFRGRTADTAIAAAKLIQHA